GRARAGAVRTHDAGGDRGAHAGAGARARHRRLLDPDESRGRAGRRDPAVEGQGGRARHQRRGVHAYEPCRARCAARGARAVRRSAPVEPVRPRARAAALDAGRCRGGHGDGVRGRELSAGTRGPGRLSPGPPWHLTGGAGGRRPSCGRSTPMAWTGYWSRRAPTSATSPASPGRPRWWPWRAAKDVGEVTASRAAALLAGEALRGTLAQVHAGMTELAIAGLLEGALRQLGSEGHPFATIVASGPRSALPHARSSGRVVAMGEWLLLDLGAQG